MKGNADSLGTQFSTQTGWNSHAHAVTDSTNTNTHTVSDNTYHHDLN